MGKAKRVQVCTMATQIIWLVGSRIHDWYSPMRPNW